MTTIQEEYFWDRVHKTGTCWLWTGSMSAKGYGVMPANEDLGRLTTGAHRFSYELANGLVAEGVVVDHRCHRPICVNPEHLRGITQKQNAENRKGANINSKSGVRGVFFHAATRKWTGRVYSEGDQRSIGYHDTIEEAAEAVRLKRNEMYTHNDVDRAPVDLSSEKRTTLRADLRAADDLMTTMMLKLADGAIDRQNAKPLIRGMKDVLNKLLELDAA